VEMAMRCMGTIVKVMEEERVLVSMMGVLPSALGN
jgi:hypothetical protein